MKTKLIVAIGATLTGAAVLVAGTASAAPAPATPETGCHNLLPSPVPPATEPKPSAVGATQIISSAVIGEHKDPVHVGGLHTSEASKEHKAEIDPSYFERGGVARVELSLEAPVSGCLDSTYSLELYTPSKPFVLLDDVRVTGALATTNDDKKRVLLSALIDDANELYFGKDIGSCSNARLVVRDPAGSVVDVEPNTGFHKVCSLLGGGTNYSG